MERIQVVVNVMVALICILTGCETKQQVNGSLSRSAVTSEAAEEADIDCIKDIYISAAPPTEEGPDAVVIVIYSSNILLNHVLDSGQVKRLLFWQKSFVSAEDSVAVQSHHVRAIKLEEKQYKLYFSTMKFRFDSSGEVATAHEDLKEDAKIKIFSNQDEVWEVRTCP